MVLALSLQTDIKSIGAYAGFAAIVGLALLVILYFSQAREMRRMADRLEEQEDRLRRLPAPSAMTVARPVALAQPAVVARPGVPLAPVPAAPATATVAIPGARRVSVAGAAAAGTPAGEAAAATMVSAGAASPASAAGPPAPTPDPAVTQAAGEPTPPANVPPAPLSPPAPASPPAVVAPATAAGAMATGADASAEAVAAVPGARRISLAELTGEEPPRPEGEDTTVVVKPSPAMPLVARAAATAEPVGAAAALGGEESKDADGPDTSETGVVAIAPPAERDADIAAPSWEEPERSDEPPASVRGASAPARERGARGSRDEPAVLAPATAAGSRPRYPPPPPLAAGRADPVGATARVSASAAAAAGGGGATLRRERPSGEESGDGSGRSGSGSTLRLAIIAVVLVGVIVLVASQLLSGGSTPSPGSTTTTNTGSNPAPSNVTVAVLNGTTQGGLATRVSGTLASEGYRRGAVANAPTQNHISTVVEYTTGNRNAAIEVAIALALTPAQVVPASGATLAAASQSGASPPTAIVVLGSNYAQQ